MSSTLQSPRERTPYSSGIYNHLGSENKNSFGITALIPGLPHIFSGKQRFKGFLLLTSSVVCLLVILALLLPQLPSLIRDFVAFCGNKNAEEVSALFQFSWLFKLFFIALLSILISFLINENQRDITKNFRNLEADRKPALLATSISSSYLLTISSFFTLLFYGLIFQFVPIKKDRSIEIEMVSPFVDNPIQKKEPKTPPKDAKNVAVQNAVNSGRYDKTLPVSPGTKQPTPKPQAAQPSKPAESNRPQQSMMEKLMQPRQAPSPPSPVAAPRPKASQSMSKSLLPSFKPKASEDRAILSSNDTAPSSPVQPISPSGGPSGRSSNTAASSFGGPSGRGPVLPSRQGGFSSGAGLGNAGPNNNPNGPVTVAARKDVDYGAFMQDLQRRIQQAWKPISGDKADQTTLSFVLRKDGSLVPGSLTTVKVSSPEAEAAARQAVIAASPGFRALPEGSADQVRIDFTFTRTGTKSMSIRKY